MRRFRWVAFALVLLMLTASFAASEPAVRSDGYAAAGVD
jgi:hypothetical protein